MVSNKQFNQRLANTWFSLEPSSADQSSLDLFLFASFGSAPVLLEGEGFSAKCKMWLSGSTVHIDFEACTVFPYTSNLTSNSPSFLHERYRGKPGTEESRDPTKFGMKIAPTKGEVSADFEHSFNDKEKSKVETEYLKQARHKPWDMIGPQTLVLETNETSLHGMLVPGLKGWRVEPKADANRSLITASLYVEEEFCHFKMHPAPTAMARMGQSFREFFSTAATREKRMFAALLETLAAEGLISSKATSALLAVHQVGIEKNNQLIDIDDEFDQTYSQTTIHIDTEPLHTFVASSTAVRLEILEGYGVPTTSFPQPQGALIQDLAPQTRLEQSTEQDEKTTVGRRKISKSYDFLLLEALAQRQNYGFPISQSILFELASQFDRNSKKASLIAKLNRWRNNKRWVHWVYPEDIQITDEGMQQRDALRPLVQGEGDSERISKAFASVLKISVAID